MSEKINSEDILAELRKLQDEVAELRGQNRLVTKTAADKGASRSSLSPRGDFSFLGEVTRSNRAAKAVETRKEGFSWDEVAEAVGYRTGACAHTRARTFCIDNGVPWPIRVVGARGNADKRRVRIEGTVAGKREYELYASMGEEASWEAVKDEIGEVGYHGTYRRAQKYATNFNLPFPPKYFPPKYTCLNRTPETLLPKLLSARKMEEVEEIEDEEDSVQVLLDSADDYTEEEDFWEE